jgi:poly-beta-1,6-N-acetyl-D-glucosamine synthase
MIFWKCLFIAGLGILFFNYAGYALFIYPFVLIKRKKRKGKNPVTDNLPHLSFIVAAYNEESCIRAKLENSLQQVYPESHIEFIFITDGSSDKTPLIVKEYSKVKLLHQTERAGKTNAINRAVAAASGEIVVFSDANTQLNKEACLHIAKHFADPKIGGVAGEKKVVERFENEDTSVGSEGLYWKYESFLKKIDSDFYSVVGAAGELFSLRKCLYEPVSNNVILDDFVLSMKAAQKGYRIIYEPAAYAKELPSLSSAEEQKRKIRIGAGGYQAIVMLGTLFQFWKHPALFYLYFSHRLLRWAVSPYMLITCFFSNLVLVLVYNAGTFYSFMLAAQAVFYLIALRGFLRREHPGKSGLVKICYYFVFMNFSVIRGLIRYLRGSQSSSWEKSKRREANAL